MYDVISNPLMICAGGKLHLVGPCEQTQGGFLRKIKESSCPGQTFVDYYDLSSLSTLSTHHHHTWLDVCIV